MLKTSQLYRIDECPELMADGCICDEHGQLLFLSVWARDTAIQAFLARLTLGQDEQGLDHFHIVTDLGHAIPLFVGNADRLQKSLSRHYRRTLFGSLVHLWLYDKRCVQPDKANASALLLIPKERSTQEQLWNLVKETCPLPLLDHWHSIVLDLLQSHHMLARLPLALGPLVGYQLKLDIPVLTTALGELIRSNRLGVTPDALSPRTPLRQIA